MTDAARSTTAAPAVPDTGAARREQRRAHRHDMSRTQLLDAAEEVLGRKGARDATLREVAERAGFSVGSVYSFFENKDDLIRQVYLRRGDEFMPVLRELIQTPGPPMRVLHDVLAFQVQYFRDHPSLGRLYLLHSGEVVGSDASAPFDEAVAANFREAMELQADLFRRGQEAGEVCGGDPGVLSRMFSGLVAAYQQTDPAVVGDDPDAGERFPLDDLHALVDRAFSA